MSSHETTEKQPPEVNQMIAAAVVLLLIVLEWRVSVDEMMLYRIILHLFALGFCAFLTSAAWFLVHDVRKWGYTPRLLKHIVLCLACWGYVAILFVRGEGCLLWLAAASAVALAFSQTVLLHEAVAARGLDNPETLSG